MAVALSADRPRKSANFLTCVLGLSRRIVMSSISRRRNGLMALSVIGAPVLGEVLGPSSQDRTPASRYSTSCHQLPRERFRGVPGMFNSSEVKVLYPT